jgi:hypothetical protein
VLLDHATIEAVLGTLPRFIRKEDPINRDVKLLLNFNATVLVAEPNIRNDNPRFRLSRRNRVGQLGPIVGEYVVMSRSTLVGILTQE